MLVYPKAYFNSVKDITIKFLKQNNIKGLLLDVDNTLIDIDRKMPEGVKQWIESLKKNEFKLCILSNTNILAKVENLAKDLDLPFIYFAKKPLKSGFKKGVRILELPKSNIAVVGDQIMTDVVGANRCKMFSILVKPIKEKDIFITRIKRPIENMIIKRYLKTKEKKGNG